MSRRFLVIAFLALSILGVVASNAHAEPAARFVYLRGKGTESCPSEADVRQAVQVRLGYDPFSSYASSTMFAEVSAVQSPSSGGAGATTFTAALKLVDADNAVRGDRVLKAHGQCADLMEAMALTISIAIDPMSVTRNGPPPDAPPSEKPVAPLAPIDGGDDSGAAATLAPDDPDLRKKPRSPPARMMVSLGPLMSIGSAPAVAFGGVLSLDAQKGALMGGIEGRADAPASADANRALGRVRSRLVAASIFAGIREGIFFACAVGSMGSLSATSENVAESHDVSALIANTGMRLGIAIPLLSDRLEFRARVEGLANLTRHTLEISGQPAFQYPAVSGDVSGAIALRFF